jgi:MoxR-like ATPase
MISKKQSTMSDKDQSALSFVMSENGGFSSTLQKEAQEKKDVLKKQKEALEAKKRVEKEKELKESLSSDQFLLTDMTEGRLPASGVNHVMFRYPQGTWDEMHELNIPEVDKFYYWDADVLEALWVGYVTNTNVLAVGPPGTGKTSAGNQLAAWIRQPYARFNGKEGIEPASFLGYPWATKEGMEWKDGLMTQAVEHGYYTAIDEIFKLPPGIQMAMQSLYEKDGFLMLDEKPGTIREKHIQPRKEFRILGTDNTKGTGDDLDLYPAGQMQDISSIDRFGITVEMGYMKPAVEQKILGSMFPNLEESIIRKSVAMANLVRTAFVKNNDLSLTMSLRGLRVTCEIVEQGLSLAAALNLSYINKLGDDSEIRTAKGFVKDAI